MSQNVWQHSSAQVTDTEKKTESFSQFFYIENQMYKKPCPRTLYGEYAVCTEEFEVFSMLMENMP